MSERTAEEADRMLSEAVASELTDLRVRGIGRVDSVVGNKPALATPNLDALVARRADDGSTGRAERIEHFIKRGLSAQQKDSLAAASLLRQLFFTPNGQVASRDGEPKALLDHARKAAGASESAFRNTRRDAVAELSGHLVALVRADDPLLVDRLIADLEPDETERRTDDLTPRHDEAASSPASEWKRRRTLLALGAVMGVAGAVIGGLAAAGEFSDSPRHPVPPHDASGPVRQEQAGRNGANTFSDPYGLSGPSHVGQRAVIRVKCRWFHPEPESVTPDGFWYLIASGSEAGRWTPANSYLNGDVYGGPTRHNVDKGVPLCR